MPNTPISSPTIIHGALVSLEERTQDGTVGVFEESEAELGEEEFERQQHLLGEAEKDEREVYAVQKDLGESYRLRR